MTDSSEALVVPSQVSSPTTGGDHRVHDILGVRVCATTYAKAQREIERVIDGGDHRKLSFLNAHGANLAYGDAEYRSILEQFTVVSDGVGLDLGARMLYGSAFPENLNGTDFVPELFKRLTKSRHIALLGAKPGVADVAAREFSKASPQHTFTVVSDGYFGAENEKQILDQLEQLRPDILLVAFGNPIQEKWIAEKCTGKHAAVCMGVGALLDFVSGSVPRAPQLLIKWRLEWLFRLWLEPRRMWRRYVIGNPLFIGRILRQKWFGSRHGVTR